MSRLTKDDLAQLIHLGTYDTALPQDWLDDYVDSIMHRLGYNKRKGDMPPNHLHAFELTDEQYQELRGTIYDTVLQGTVWAYGSTSAGFPVAVTPLAYALACLDAR